MGWICGGRREPVVTRGFWGSYWTFQVGSVKRGGREEEGGNGGGRGHSNAWAPSRIERKRGGEVIIHDCV